jgi:hypothetical protein
LQTLVVAPSATVTSKALLSFETEEGLDYQKDFLCNFLWFAQPYLSAMWKQRNAFQYNRLKDLKSSICVFTWDESIDHKRIFNESPTIYLPLKKVAQARLRSKPRIWGRCYDHNILRFLTIFGEKIGVFLKNQCYDQNFCIF